MSKVEVFQADAAGSLTGTVFYKQIVRYGTYVDPWDPQSTMTLDAAWAKKIIANFGAKVIDRVPVPRNHTNDVNSNTGEVIKLESKADGLYAYIDIRDPQTVTDLENGLIFDDSISFDWDYVDTETGKHWGPVLLHVALVNNPYLTHMKPFERVEDMVGAFANKVQEALGLAQNRNTGAIMLSESKVKELRSMKLSKVTNDKEFEVTIKVKGDDGVEVDKKLAAGEEVEVPEEQAEAIKQQIADSEDPNGGGSDDDDNDDDTDEDDNKGGDDDKSEALSRANAKIREYEAEKAYNTLLSKGKILPAQKEAFIALASAESQTSVKLSKDGKAVSLSKALVTLFNSMPKLVNLNAESGSDGKPGDGKETDANKKPSERLNEKETKGMQAVGASPERLDELSSKYPEMASTLEKLDESKGDK